MPLNHPLLHDRIRKVHQEVTDNLRGSMENSGQEKQRPAFTKAEVDAAMNVSLEASALLCDKWAARVRYSSPDGCYAAEQLAEAIRALKT